MNTTKGSRAINEIKSIKQRLVDDVREFARAAQRFCTQVSNRVAIDSRFLRLRIDRHNPTNSGTNFVDKGIRHSPTTIKDSDLSKNRDGGSDWQELQAPPLIEETDVKRTGVVSHGDDDELASVLAPDRTTGLHRCEKYNFLIEWRIANRDFFRAIDVTARIIRQHIEHGTNTERCQCFCPLGRHTFQFSDRQIGELCQPTSHDLAHSIPKR